MADPSKDKAQAKEHLLAADKYVKGGNFEKARAEIITAKSLDPSNPYIPAFEDRVKYFETEHVNTGKSKADASAAQTVHPPSSTPVEVLDPVVRAKGVTTAASPPAPTSPKPGLEAAPQQPKEPAPSAITKPKIETPPPVKAAPIPQPAPEVRKPSPVAPPSPPQNQELSSGIDDMKRQLLELTKALEQERKAREEINKQQAETSMRTMRRTLEKAWQFGAPKPHAMEEVHSQALALNIAPEVLDSLVREVKLAMYSIAVKDVLAKRKLLRSSSSTTEWLRKVYQISLNEYLEYESQFLMDLVADQFKGTMLFVCGDKLRSELLAKLKSIGFAVVSAPDPESALEKVEKVMPTLILSETTFQQGSLSGHRFLNLLRGNPRFSFIPFLFVCDAGEKDQLESSELRPNEGYVCQPVDFDELNSMINEKLQVMRTYIASLG